MITAQKLQVAVAAAIGGIAPNVLRIALSLTGDQRHDPGVNTGYVVGLVLLAGLGCLIALIWNERKPQRAFYLGMGLPALLQVAMITPAQAPAANASTISPPAATQTILSLFSNSAFAQPALPPAGNVATQAQGLSQSRTLTIAFTNVPTDAQLIFLDRDGRTIDQQRPVWTKFAQEGMVLVHVPDGATEIEVISAFARNSPDKKLRFNKTTGALEPLLLQTKSDFAAGFLKAFGRQAADAMTLSAARPSPPK